MKLNIELKDVKVIDYGYGTDEDSIAYALLGPWVESGCNIKINDITEIGLIEEGIKFKYRNGRVYTCTKSYDGWSLWEDEDADESDSDDKGLLYDYAEEEE